MRTSTNPFGTLTLKDTTIGQQRIARRLGQPNGMKHSISAGGAPRPTSSPPPGKAGDDKKISMCGMTDLTALDIDIGDRKTGIPAFMIGANIAGLAAAA